MVSVQEKESNSLKCLYTNTDSLLNKRDELLHSVVDNCYDIICLNEIIPKNTRFQVQKCELKIEGYDLFTNIPDKDNKTKLRGIVMYVRQKWGAQQAYPPKEYANTKESVWCELGLRNKAKLLIGTCYRSPSSNKENNGSLNMLLNTMVSNRRHVLMVGDFNFPEINWTDYTCPKKPEHSASIFLETMKDNFLHQHVQKPTHHRGDQQPTLIDLVLTSEENVINNLIQTAPLGKSHHQCIIFNYVCTSTENTAQTSSKYCYDKGDYSQMREKLETMNLAQQMEGMRTQEAWDTLSSAINELCQEFIPRIKTNRPGNKNKKPLWFNEKALQKIKKKSETYKKYLDTKEGKDYITYTRARNQAKKACREAVKDYEKQIAQQAKINPKKFYAYAKSKMTTTEGIPDLQTKEGTIITSDEDKSDLLNSFFCSVFTKENTASIPDPNNLGSSKNSLDKVDIDPDKVKKILRTLNISKSAGPDNMHPRVLKELSEQLAEPLTYVFKVSISEGVLPEQWKQANVTPLFKKGNKSDPNNYRPVSLTSIPCKMLEKIVRDALFQHLDKNAYITECQHGFVPKRSCVTNLVEILDKWTENLDKGITMDAIYLDFSKAFDSVPHQRLIKKLEGYGISGNILNWIKSFLLDRKQRVKVNGFLSDWKEVTSGVPQGSVLGPVLFVLFINDLPEEINKSCSMYADDTKLYGPAEEHEEIQLDLDRLVDWADKWQMKFNAGKCSVLHLGNKNKRHEYSMRTHGSQNRVKLTSADVERDLGIQIDSQLRFTKHTETQVNKANRLLGLIRRSYVHLDKDSMRSLFIALVRPHLEFANCAWGPHLEKDKNQIESVLHRATKCIPGLHNMDYEERLKITGIPSMSYRRIRGDLIEIYKYTHGLYKCASPLPLNPNGPTRGHIYKLKKQFCATSLRQGFFTSRAVDTWNNLDDAVVNAETLNSFKNIIDNVFKDFLFCSDLHHPLRATRPVPAATHHSVINTDED